MFGLACSGDIEAINYESKSILVPCLVALSEKYFKPKRALRGSLVIVNRVPHPRSFLQRRMLQALNENEKHPFGVMVKDARNVHKNASKVTDKAQNYMLLMIELNDLSMTLKQWKSLPTWNPNAPTVVVLLDPLESVEVKDRLVKRIFSELLASSHIFANVIYTMADDPYKMEAETWFPYFNDSCASSVEYIFRIDECTVPRPDDNEAQSEMTIIEFNQEKYPKVPNALHDCPMKVSTFIWEPFVAGSKKTVSGGLEVQMLQTITKQMALKLNFKIMNNEIAAKKISDDNQTGIYADLIQK